MLQLQLPRALAKSTRPRRCRHLGLPAPWPAPRTPLAIRTPVRLLRASAEHASDPPYSRGFPASALERMLPSPDCNPVVGDSGPQGRISSIIRLRGPTPVRLA